jgi:hypothetical protein
LVGDAAGRVFLSSSTIRNGKQQCAVPFMFSTWDEFIVKAAPQKITPLCDAKDSLIRK